MATSWPLRPESWCKVRASSSLPVPGSPVMSTLTASLATRPTTSGTPSGVGSLSGSRPTTNVWPSTSG